MLAEFGQLFLISALLIAALQASLPLLGARYARSSWMQMAPKLALLQCLAIAAAFAVLSWAFISHDLSVAYVAQHSHIELPAIYQFTAVWGGHEGSFLLWLLILSIWGAAVALFTKSIPEKSRALVLAILGMVSVGFIAFIVFTSNPFERLLPAALTGQDLNPLLQDPGMILHPPLLYIGYVGFAVSFAFALASLIDSGDKQQWMRWSRPWTNVAWGFLTLGIALGSYWAYYELGWGGWWFWDPVENASFMPWLAGIALIHSQAVTEKRGIFYSWTTLLAIAAFSLSLLGTFLVRSGVITSVHSFASDPERGLFILGLLVIVVGGSLLLFALRNPSSSAKPFALYSRETLLLVNNLLLTVATMMILLGTLYPLLAEALDMGKVSVGPPYFGFMFFWLMAPLVLLIPFGPLTRWQQDKGLSVLKMLTPWLLISVLLGALMALPLTGFGLRTALGFIAGVWLLLGTGHFVRARWKNSGRLSAEMIGLSLAHIGVGVFVIGVLVNESTMIEKDVAAAPGQQFELRGYTFEFAGTRVEQGPNYISDLGEIRVYQSGELIKILHPEKRFYTASRQIMTEADFSASVLRHLYVALGEPLDAQKSSWALRLYVKPFISWIWFGAILMALGGFVAATEKRLRQAVRSRA